MRKLHPKSDELLFKICNVYARTHSASIHTLEIDKETYDDCFYYELQDAGYIIFHNTVAPYVEVLDRTIDFARSQKLI